MTRRILTTACVAMLALGACRRSDPDAPPTIVYGESLCAECGMIISDNRFSVATIVKDDRGGHPLLFDDFNCQFNHERDRSDLVIVRRWAHDHGTRAWIDLETARFVFAPAMRTPMGSHLAAFATEADAHAFAQRQGGRVMNLGDARNAGTTP